MLCEPGPSNVNHNCKPYFLDLSGIPLSRKESNQNQKTYNIGEIFPQQEPAFENHKHSRTQSPKRKMDKPGCKPKHI